jgi:hypothetical protein
MTHEEHRARHVMLDAELDEVIVDFLVHNPGKEPATTTISELVCWSYYQRIDPAVDPGPVAAVCAHCGADMAGQHVCEDNPGI